MRPGRAAREATCRPSNRVLSARPETPGGQGLLASRSSVRPCGRVGREVGVWRELGARGSVDRPGPGGCRSRDAPQEPTIPDEPSSGCIHAEVAAGGSCVDQTAPSLGSSAKRFHVKRNQTAADDPPTAGPRKLRDEHRLAFRSRPATPQFLRSRQVHPLSVEIVRPSTSGTNTRGGDPCTVSHSDLPLNRPSLRIAPLVHRATAVLSRPNQQHLLDQKRPPNSALADPANLSHLHLPTRCSRPMPGRRTGSACAAHLPSPPLTSQSSLHPCRGRASVNPARGPSRGTRDGGEDP